MVKLSGPDLIRAVEWKIFEIQSRLVGEETTQADINDCIAWFQSRHYNEVIEERAADSRCGHPLCNKSLMNHRNQQYRINYGEKEIYKVENSCFYCSNDCLVKSVTLEKALSTEMPSSRAIARSLDANTVKGNIDDLLGLFDSVSRSKDLSGAIPAPSVATEKNEEPLPQYYNSKVSDGGKIISGDTEKPDSLTPFKEPLVTNQVARDLLDKCSNTTDPAPTQYKKERPAFIPKAPVATSTKREIIADAAATSAATADLSMDEILNKMRTIREKSSSSKIDNKVLPANPVSATANRANDNEDDDVSVGDSTDVTAMEGDHTIKSQDTSRPAAAASEGSSTSGSKREQPWSDPVPKSKSVKWQDTTSNSSGGGSSSTTATAKDNSTGGRGILANRSMVTSSTVTAANISGSTNATPKTVSRVASESVAKMKVTEKPAGAAPGGMKPKPSIMTKLGSVMERSNPQPMSLGAMMLKQENGNVVTTPATSAAISRSGMINSTSVSGIGVVDAATSAAFSIEGYVSEMRSSMRVAPITTIKNLSYDPWQRHTTASTSNASNSGEDDDVPVVEELPDEAAQQSEAQTAEEASTDNDDDDEQLEQDGDADDTGTDETPAVSLFLSVWTALDDLFSHVSMHDVDPHLPPPAPHAGGISGNSGSSSNSSEGGAGSSARAPVAAEYLQVQSAILKLLERGIKTAENLLDVSKYVITKTEINVYYVTKTRFLNSVNCRLIKCPSLKSTGWTLIGILLIDGILTRKGLLSDAYRGAVWTTIVDSMAAAALGGGHIAGSQLRMDDLKILRTFFMDL